MPHEKNDKLRDMEKGQNTSTKSSERRGERERRSSAIGWHKK